jgi:hypothetical protein
LAEFFRKVREEGSVRADDARLSPARPPNACRSTIGRCSCRCCDGRGGGGSVGGRKEGIHRHGDAGRRPRPAGGGGTARCSGPTGSLVEGKTQQPQRTEPISVPPEPGDVPSSRTEEASPKSRNDVPMSEGVTSGTPPHTPPRDVQRGGPGAGEGAREEERAGHGEEEKSLVERLTDGAGDALRGEGEQRRDR